MQEKNPLGMENCPECGMPSWAFDHTSRRHLCVNEECGFAEDEGDSILTKLLRLLRIKK